MVRRACSGGNPRTARARRKGDSIWHGKDAPSRLLWYSPPALCVPLKESPFLATSRELSTCEISGPTPPAWPTARRPFSANYGLNTVQVHIGKRASAAAEHIYVSDIKVGYVVGGAQMPNDPFE